MNYDAGPVYGILLDNQVTFCGGISCFVSDDLWAYGLVELKGVQIIYPSDKKQRNLIFALKKMLNLF